MSDSSSVSSTKSYGGSPYSSPSQQVPGITMCLTELTCTDNGRGPYLQITEQPQDYFRFRYVSEMVGTHGCILGKSYALKENPGKAKTYPTVVLKNYNGRAIVRCKLVQDLNEEEHPHRLLEDDEDREISHQVPDDGHYEVAFAGMGIIHTGKKEVAKVLLHKYREKLKNTSIPAAALKKKCDDMARGINLNIVRLKFSAHDVMTDEEICQPVISQPINNMKSAATNDVKICRMSLTSSKPVGGIENFILVEKVNKKNIKVRFFELDGDKEVWTKEAYFLQSDVHHQYAIVFRIPPYQDRHITSEVKVWVELFRPSDGKRSEPRPFTYKPDIISRQNKKRKANSSYSSFESNSSLNGGSTKSYNIIPTPVLDLHKDVKANLDDLMIEIEPSYPIQQNINVPTCDDDMTGDALLANMTAATNSTHIDFSPIMPHYKRPSANQLEQPTSNSLQQISFNSTEVMQLLEVNQMPSQERQKFYETDLSDYYENVFGRHLMSDGGNKDSTTNSMDFIRSVLVTDSPTTGPKPETSKIEDKTTVKPEVCKPVDKREQLEYTAYYSAEDGAEVKKLVKELVEVIRKKTQIKKQDVKAKLERLFELRLYNGDTFLHMTLCNNKPSLDYIVRIIDNMKMTHLLNLKNKLGQTVLHLAVLYDLPKEANFLISKGCSPNEQDIEGNTPVHYAVKYQTCMESLLQAIKAKNIASVLNTLNLDQKSPLHLAAIYNSETEARFLLQNGASCNVKDGDGRTPLHLAAFEDCLPVTKALLDFIELNDIDMTDSYGNTALQIICGGGLRENTEDIVHMLLQKKADPMFHVDGSQPAWKLVREKEKLRDIMMKYLTTLQPNDDNYKSEPEDEYESFDDMDSEDTCLSDMSQYIEELSTILDENGSWKVLAAKLNHGSLLNWYENTRSPTRTLLGQVKESGDNLSSKSLALVLDDIGQSEAAGVIRKHT